MLFGSDASGFPFRTQRLTCFSLTLRALRIGLNSGLVLRISGSVGRRLTFNQVFVYSEHKNRFFAMTFMVHYSSRQLSGRPLIGDADLMHDGYLF
jgi:hypothetical protein